MKKIKTKESYNIPDFTKETFNISKKINGAFIKTKTQTDKITESNQTGAYEYADESYKNMVENTSASTKDFAKKLYKNKLQKNRKFKSNHDNVAYNNKISNYKEFVEDYVSGHMMHAKAKNAYIKNNIKKQNKIPFTVKDKFVTFFKSGFNTVLNTARIAISNTKLLIASLIGAGSVGMFFVIVICVIGLVMNSSFGIFMATENTGSEYTLNEVFTIVNDEYFEEIEQIKKIIPHDDLEVEGESANWKDVLVIYAVKVTTDDEGTEVVTIDKEKMEIIRNIYWLMTEIESEIETYEEKHIIEIVDEEGNITEQEIIQIKTRLTISTKNKTAAETAVLFGFDENQIKQINELLNSKNDSLWNL